MKFNRDANFASLYIIAYKTKLDIWTKIIYLQMKIYI